MSSEITRGRLSRIDTKLTVNVLEDSWSSNPLRSRENSPESFSLPSPTSPTNINIPPPFHHSQDSRKRNETRKLLSHVLMQLANRTKPPPITETITNSAQESSETGFGALAETLREAVKRNTRLDSRSDKRMGVDEDDSDTELDNTFTTDGTLDLMIQLKDVLTLAVAQGWQIFDENPMSQSSVDGGNSRIYSTFRKSRSSFRAVGKRSPSSSPSKGQAEVPELLSLCISILGSIVSEDCRYRVASPRPSRPPNALQHLTLNIAQFMVHNHQHDPQVISHIAFVMIPAFCTFNSQMHTRLLSFFESSVMRTVLHRLGPVQGPIQARNPLSSNENCHSSLNDDKAPIVSIQIDEVYDDNNPSPHPMHVTSSTNQRVVGSQIQSTNNPGQSANIYYLASVIPPLITAILDSCEILDEVESELRLPTQLIRFLQLVASSKLDAYNDILEIVAYGVAKARRLAVASLATIWPKSAGHPMISSPWGTSKFQTGMPSQAYKNQYAHQFMPWYFEPSHRPVHSGDIIHSNCRSCLKPIHGFSLLCHCCMTAVHFDCYDYPEGNYQIQYSMENDLRMQRVAICRVSFLQPNGTFTKSEVPKDKHVFLPANWFTLCLCFVCQKPLWGCIGQGLKCGRCPISLHATCLQSFDSSMECGFVDITSKDMTVDWHILRQSCLEQFPILSFSTEQLSGSSYEEITIYQGILRSQLQILNNGIAFGSITVAQKGAQAIYGHQRNIDHFELHNTLEQCERLLSSGNLFHSTCTQQFMQDSTTASRPSIMFDWSYLEYMTAAIKTSTSHASTAPDFLNVQQPLDISGDLPQMTSYTYESAPLMHIRDILRTDFSIVSDHAAKLMLDQLHHLSFFDRTDGNVFPFKDIPFEKDVTCIFPLPLGLDLSVNVEILVSSIEACLTDIDLCINEFGFLLLTRRFWPSGLVSEYGLKRLCGKVLSWILDEDDNLATILREFVAKQKKIPGIRSDRTSQPWPPPPDLRPGPTNLVSNGGDFIAARRSISSRYALPWLLELHDLNNDFYCQIVFETCCQVAVEKEVEPGTNVLSGKAATGMNQSNRRDNLLRHIIKLSQSGVVFNVFDPLFIRWMDFALDSDAVEQTIPSILRLFLWENEATVSASVTKSDSVTDLRDTPSPSFADPLRPVINSATQSELGLSRSLLYLSMIVKSGVSIPVSTFKEFMAMVVAHGHNSLDNAHVLIKTITLSLWLRTSGREEFQILVATLHSYFSSQISQCLISGEMPLVALSVIRQSLAACLRIYGIERSSILASAIVSLSDVEHIPSRRKMNIREAAVDDPIIIHANFLAALDLYLQSNVDEVSCLIAKFLDMFLTESPFLEAFEIDNFILRNGKLITRCAWSVYDIQRDDVAVVRTNLILRSLLIDPEPFQRILHAYMDPSNSSIHQRLTGINRLFRMVSDVTSPAFDVEGRQWRSSVIEIFHYYFSAIWEDPSEEVRTAAKSSSAALLPAHFDVISQCWNESLSKAPITERIRLVGFLIQLRPHFPNWKVLSWDCVIETLIEYDCDAKSNDELVQDSMTKGNVDADMTHLRVSIILLALQMVADGIEIDNFSLMKLKVQFVTTVGFNKVSVAPTNSRQSFRLRFSDITEVVEAAYPCIEELVHVVDTPHYTKVPRLALGTTDQQEDEMVTVLVGSTFLDAGLCILSTLRDLSVLPVLTLKCILETLYIAIHKYDFEDQLFRHLQPLLQRSILRSIELLSQEISFELRQLALSIAQASIKKWHIFLGATISTIIELVAIEIASQARHSQDSLVIQGKLLIGSTLQTFCHNGLLLSLMRRPLQPSFFSVLNQIFITQGNDDSLLSGVIREALLKDTLTRAVECDIQSFQTVLENTSKFIEVVHFQGYSPDLMIFTGQQLISLARRMSDGSIDKVDPTPLIRISTILIQNNKRSSKELLPHVDTLLRVTLNRLRVEEVYLKQLVEAAASSKSKSRETTPGSIDVTHVLCDVLLDGFRMKTKMLPLTIKSVVECLISVDKASAPSSSAAHIPIFHNMIDDAYGFLQNHTWNEENIDHDFQAVMATGKLLLRATNRDPTSFQKFTEPFFDKGPRFTLTIRSWNILLLATLQEMQDDWKTMVYSQFSSFCDAYSTLLRGYVSSGISSSTAASATTDLNQAHIALRLWLMLSHSMTGLMQSKEIIVAGVWNELWPPYESFLNMLETEARVGSYPALISMASTSIADCLTYLHSLKSSLALDTSTHVAILNRLLVLHQGDATSSKIARAIRSISEPPPDTSNTIFLDQMAKELVAAEKIRIIETNGMVWGDKSRRMPTI